MLSALFWVDGEKTVISPVLPLAGHSLFISSFSATFAGRRASKINAHRKTEGEKMYEQDEAGFDCGASLLLFGCVGVAAQGLTMLTDGQTIDLTGTACWSAFLFPWSRTSTRV